MTRAQVSMIMIKEIKNGGATEHGGLLFDVSTNMKVPVLRTIYKNQMHKNAAHFLRNVSKAYGKAAAEFKEPWDVLPSAHYFMGGIRTDESCKSRVKGLYACGQAQGGVMGGNRLGSTSLTEIFVFGKRAGVAAALEAKGRAHRDGSAARDAVERLEGLFGREGKTRPVTLKKKLRELMWEYAGPLRDGNGLAAALDGLGEIKRESFKINVSSFRRYNTEVVDAIELSHMITAAEAIIISALEREETRGAHVRSDFPDTEDTTSPKNVVVRQVDGHLMATSQEAHR
jgi:succinate dehydrogenase/fumarate reductase flavoprotein subunit